MRRCVSVVPSSEAAFVRTEDPKTEERLRSVQSRAEHVKVEGAPFIRDRPAGLAQRPTEAQCLVGGGGRDLAGLGLGARMRKGTSESRRSSARKSSRKSSAGRDSLESGRSSATGSSATS